MVTAGLMAPVAGSMRTTRRAIRSDTQSWPSGPHVTSHGELNPVATTRNVNGDCADAVSQPAAAIDAARTRRRRVMARILPRNALRSPHIMWTRRAFLRSTGLGAAALHLPGIDLNDIARA